MSAPASQWRRLRQDWAGNRRLRLGALLVLLILGAHGVLALADRRAAAVEAYRRDAGLLARLQEASHESSWPARAAKAEKALADARASIPAASSDGLAQAELQAWLTDTATASGLGDPRVRVESSVDVPDQPGLWQVIARLDATVPEGALPGFVRALSGGLPWIQAERLEIVEGRPTRFSMIVRGYYRQGDDDAGATPGQEPTATGAGASATATASPPAGGPPVSSAARTPASAAATPGQPPAAGTALPTAPRARAPASLAPARPVKPAKAPAHAAAPPAAPDDSVPVPSVSKGPVLGSPVHGKKRKESR